MTDDQPTERLPVNLYKYKDDKKKKIQQMIKAKRSTKNLYTIHISAAADPLQRSKCCCGSSSSYFSISPRRNSDRYHGLATAEIPPPQRSPEPVASQNQPISHL
ncbi:hypothetical protein HAX54_048529 [Datura stramonium]|uniref:Uncharacterized protein n=1 Tax=Datura stramonium TaxID=4076 RepID=A0ABS8STR7_DATST|nr:hypothetical protein [Datura stramonium]